MAGKKTNTLVKSTYKANVEISFQINEGESFDIAYERVKYIILDNMYEELNTPKIILSIACTKKLYNAIVDNEKNAKFKLDISIYNAKTNMPLKHPTNIQGLFTYVVSTNNPNFYQDLSNTSDVGDRSNSYIGLVVGLVSMDALNVLRAPVNEILQTDTFTFLTRMINKVKYAMSELDNNEELETMVASPRSTIVSAIDDIIRDNPFYNTKTRLFADFDKLYLLKTDGSYTEAHDGDLEGFIFKIAKVTNSSSYNEGFYEQDGAYIVDVNPGMVNIVDNSSMDRVCNNIVSIDQLAEESVSAVDLDVKTDEDAKVRTVFMCTETPEMYKNIAESNTATLEIVKDDIDMSVITPNKTYRINVSDDMGKEYKKYDDTYTLVYKKVILRNFNGDFTMSTNIGLRKIGNIVPVTRGKDNDSATKKYTTSKNNVNNNNPNPNNPTDEEVAGEVTTSKPKRLFYKSNRPKKSLEEKLPPVQHLKGVSLQRSFKSFDEYYNEKKDL